MLRSPRNEEVPLTLRPLQSPPEGWESDSDQDCPQLFLLTVSRLLPQTFPCWLGEKTEG